MDRVLAGRAVEVDGLHAWLAHRASSRPGQAPPLLFVGGEAGVGKTALLHAALRGVDGRVIRRAAGAPWERRPFGVLHELLAGAGADPTGEVEEIRSTLLADGRPTVLVLDDLHWSDEASLEVLAQLAGTLVDDRVAILGAYRSDELPRDHLLRRLRARLRHRRLLCEIALEPLRGHALCELIAAIAGAVPDEALAAAIADRTAGLPFFVEELLAALRQAGRLAVTDGTVALAADDGLPLPDSIRDAVALRVAGMDERVRVALDVAAVLGAEVDVGLVATLTGEQWPDELDHSGLFTAATRNTRRFRHVLVEEALRADVPWSRRRALHLAIAEQLQPLPDTETVVARHLLAAHDPIRARPLLLGAADRCLRVRAYRDAARLLETAIESWPDVADQPARLDAVDRLAQCWELCGEHAAAIANLRELAQIAGTAGTHRRLATQYELLGQWPPALAAREAAAAVFARAGDRGEAAAERLAVAAHLRSAASLQAALDTIELAAADAISADRVDLSCRIEALRGNVLARMGRAEEGITAVRSALERALGAGLTVPAAEVYQRLADSIEHAGDYRGALQAYDGAYEFCRVHAQDAVGQLCRACATVVLFNSGRWDGALGACREILDDERTTPHARAVACGVIGLVHAMRGRAGPARAALLESRVTATRIDLVAMELLATWGLALLDEAAGRLDRARASYRHIVTRCRETDERHYCVPVLQFAAARFAADGAAADLAVTTEVLADAVARTGQREARAALSYALGEAALADPGAGHVREARTHLARAVDELAHLDLPVVHALAQHRAALVIATEEPAAAAQLLNAAFRTAQRLKARTLSERIAPDVRRFGRRLDSGPDVTGLTPREFEVLLLVGDGLTNREIAQRLHLSVRTVEMHVRNAVAALGCRTRAEAVRRLVTAQAR